MSNGIPENEDRPGLLPPAAAPTPWPVAVTARFPTRARTPARRVLIVERDLNHAALLTGAVRGQGYDVVLVGDADQAWERLQESHFATVVCRWRLPGTSSLGLLRQVRGRHEGGYIYFIAISEGDEPSEVQHCMDAGADDVLIEPVDPLDLVARLRVAQRIARMQDDITASNRTLSSANRRLETVNQKMRRDLDSAVRVQQALLPTAQIDAPGLDLAWRMRPSDALAGDILNYFRIDEQHVAFYVLDVSGHGVSSALLSVQIARLMSPVMSQSELVKQRLGEAPWYRLVEPLAVVRTLNEMFQTNDEISKYSTLVYGLIEPTTGRVRFVSAGHPGPVHVPAAGEAVEIVCAGNPIGVFPDPQLDEVELTLCPGDRLYFFSDGLYEVMNAQGRMLGLEGLKAHLIRHRGRPLDETVGKVIAEVEKWCAPALPADDCSLLGIQRT